MSDLNRNYAVETRRAVAIDAGLRAYMIRVYNYMAAGVALTGTVAWLTFQAAVVTDANGAVGVTPFSKAIFSGPAIIIMMLGTLGLVMFLSFRIQRLQPATALAAFMIYAALLGLMLSSVFLAYTGASVTRAFFISAASFGAMSLYGYTTQRSLSAMGSFLIMGMFGLLIAMVISIFLKSTALDFAISAAGVLIFAGMTAWDTQRIKEMYDPMQDGTAVGPQGGDGCVAALSRLYQPFLIYASSVW